ncbi:MAG: hypothetical protein CMF74_09275 [Maricaulis sp.]|jgi:hypothetical protein|nr:hypothetical protein [Maricaulis sp.]HAQ36027.1 DUF2093 domain-containing protein [Alphaproteobacteria bacterium]|tara:strand:+ start:303 stop:527 length:225 start_codon:yes stop_codon:yes gene_type:complete
MTSAFDKEFSGEAVLEFTDSDFMILKPGNFVRCAVTGDPIPLRDLRYWSAELQEPYKDAYASVKRWQELNGAGS